MMRPRGFTSVMANRQPTAPDDLEYFPTPPWATRALFPLLLELSPHAPRNCREPACGEGIMAEVLKELFRNVLASDIFDYGYDYGAVEDYLDPTSTPIETDWVITNPPFTAAMAFLKRAMKEARMGVALLVRLQFLEGAERWREVFADNPPAIIAVFVDRVAMTKGEWKPGASTATAYAWLIWRGSRQLVVGSPQFRWIEPGAKARLTHPDDIRRFARVAPAPLFQPTEEECPR